MFPRRPVFLVFAGGAFVICVIIFLLTLSLPSSSPSSSSLESQTATDSPRLREGDSASPVVETTVAANTITANQTGTLSRDGYFLLMQGDLSRMGLTNRLISISEAMFLAAISRRTLVLPHDPFSSSSSSRPSVLLDLESTMKGSSLKILAFEEYEQSVAAKSAKFKPVKLKLPSRTQVLKGDAAARAKLLRDIDVLSHAKLVRVGTTFWHVPWRRSEGDDPARFFTALSFSKEVQDQANAVIRDKMSGAAIHVAFHARFEPDVSGFGSDFSPPRPEQLAAFLERCLIPRVSSSRRQHETSTLYLAAGTSMSRALRNVIVCKFTASGFRVFSRDGELDCVDTAHSRPTDFPLTTASSSSSLLTNHLDAAVDSLLAQRATVVIGSDYSTFTKAIQIRKCLAAGAGGNSSSDHRFTLVTYDHKLSRVVVYHRDSRECETVLASNFATTPHSYVPGFSSRRGDLCSEHRSFS